MIEEHLLLEKLEQIHKVLQNKYTTNDNMGVLSGISGISLFQFYYSRFSNKEEPGNVGVKIITTATERLNNGYNFPTFCTGIAGYGWTLELLAEEEFIVIDTDILLSGLDDYLFENMKSDIKHQNFDFLHGAIGYGYYFLKRFKNTKSPTLKLEYEKYLCTLIGALRVASRKNEKGIWWEYELHEKDQIFGANLSLSHGMSSIINFLCRLHSYNEFQKLVYDLLIGASRFIIGNKYKVNDGSSLFPSWVYEKMEGYTANRLAWCYGDLGIGITIWKVGKALENIAYKEMAIYILKNAAKRKDLEETRVIDAGLCHGAYGIVTIFNYMYKETNELIFKETADFWMHEGLKMSVHESEYAGYMQWRGDLEEWRSETNLLEGLAGIGLAIISYLHPKTMSWSQCLMIQ